MKTSQYNFLFGVDGKHYVYNALSTSILSIPDHLYRKIEKESIDELSYAELDVLSRNGIIVNDELDEKAVFEHFYRTVQFGTHDKELRIVILPTFSCNLHCSYCFESNLEETKLDINCLPQILSFTKRELHMRNYKSLKMVLFGGEPLIKKDLCMALTKSLCAIAKSLSLSFESQIITNGVLLDENIIRDMIIPYRMRIQLTIDGSRRVHDERRVFHSGRGTYDIIKEKILLLNSMGCKDLIDLRVNIDKKNIQEFHDVFKEFSNLCGFIYPGLLRPLGGNACNADSCFEDNDYIINIRPKLFEIMGRKGESISFGKKKPCSFNRNNSFIIAPSLDVYKCENLVGQKAFSVGSINDDGVLVKNAEFYKQSTWSPFKFNKCINCKLLPACASECPFQGIIENSSYEKPLCSTNEDNLIKALQSYVMGNES